ncbi:MAG TPA: hypothetical protein VM008_06565 [Phycisphaerae bacterium]|nr:hypothetical protein [Phycisphaerae bacterium]
MQFFHTRSGKALLFALAIAALGLVGYQLYAMIRPNDGTSELNRRWFVCTETRKAYQLDLTSVREIPAPSPFSGKNTGEPAELCYWTAEGKTKDTPTPVLLNEYIGDPSPTFCPDCGRLVVGRNPAPTPGSPPPPTKAEYQAVHHHAATAP